MNDKSDAVILDTDDSAACSRLETVWVSRRGNWFKTEESARFDGCTHQKCKKCENFARKFHNYCDECSTKARAEREQEIYLKMPFKKWDYEMPVYSLFLSQFFHDECEINDELEENPEIKSDMLMLVLCKEVKPNLITLDYFMDDVSEECHESFNFESASAKEIEETINHLNSLIQKIDWGFEEGCFRTEYKPD